MNGFLNYSDEMKRVHRVSDMLCTAHAGLRNRYHKRALYLDMLILAVSLWLVALVFVDPAIDGKLTPFEIDGRLWIGCLSIGVFLLTLLHLKFDWRGKSVAHQRTLDMYATTKREATYVLAAGQADEPAVRRVLVSYDMASAVGMPVPEKEFLRQKKRHKIKIEISKRLDSRPSTSIYIMRLRLWWRDNLKGIFKHGG